MPAQVPQYIRSCNRKGREQRADALEPQLFNKDPARFPSLHFWNFDVNFTECPTINAVPSIPSAPGEFQSNESGQACSIL
jgi:hypothetical protein